MIHFRDGSGGRRFAYAAGTADPLHLGSALNRLDAAGRLDAGGFASEADWFRETALADFPAALARLVNSLTGPDVRNNANVIFSLRPGYAWGWKSAHVSAWLAGGRLEGTHGGLDRESSLAFLLTDDPSFTDAPALSVRDALRSFSPFRACFDPTAP